LPAATLPINLYSSSHATSTEYMISAELHSFNNIEAVFPQSFFIDLDSRDTPEFLAAGVDRCT
jgi:hypothetical protein